MEEIAERYPDALKSRLDGISIDYPDWHFNVRPSNTEPLLRLCLESLNSWEDMEKRRDEVLAVIRAYSVSCEPPTRGREPLEPDEAELLDRAREAGIIRLKVPTPF